MSKLLSYGIMQQKRKANLILDDYGTGIAAAFSLRKLKSDYTGYCIELIRSSDGAMKNIGFVNGVVDTDEILSFLSVGEYGAVETWYDQSGNSNDIITFDTRYQASPKITDTNKNILTENSKFTLDFGTNSESRFLLFPSGFMYNEAAFSLFMVSKITDYTNSLGGILGNSGAVQSYGIEIMQYSYYSVRAAFRINAGSGVFTPRNNNSGESYQLWNNDTQSLTSIHANSSAVSAYKNGSSVSLTDTTGISALTYNGVYALGYFYSSSYPMSGKIQEFIIYDSIKSSDRSGIESNINTYYSIY